MLINLKLWKHRWSVENMYFWSSRVQDTFQTISLLIYKTETRKRQGRKKTVVVWNKIAPNIGMLLVVTYFAMLVSVVSALPLDFRFAGISVSAWCSFRWRGCFCLWSRQTPPAELLGWTSTRSTWFPHRPVLQPPIRLRPRGFSSTSYEGLELVGGDLVCVMSRRASASM